MAYLQTMPKATTLELREKHVGQACQLFYRGSPLKVVRAEGQYMYDEAGERYLDCINNVAHVGHCHPRVVEAGRRQMSLVATNSRFLHDELSRLAARLAASLPAPLSVAFLVNSGSEANDLALRLARAHTRRTDVVVLDHAYHGHLTTLMELSPYKHNLPGAPPKPDWVHVAPAPDTYRGVYRRREAEAGGSQEERDAEEEALGLLYAQEVQAACARAALRGGACAFIAESLLSCGGQIIPPRGYLPKVYEHVRAAGGVCIADEVQVGFGRVGSHLWAFEALGALPDVVTVGKPMGNGHPVAAVVTTPDIARSFHATGVEYFNTYGGNPVSCAVANAVLDVLEEEGLQAKAAQVGAHLLARCQQLRARHALVGDVRGLGLFVGLELVTERASRAPASAEAAHLVRRLRDERVLVSRDGPDGNVLKLKPPLVFTARDADRVVDTLDRLLAELTHAPKPPKPHAEPHQVHLEVRVTPLEEPAPAPTPAAAVAPEPRAVHTS